MEEEKKTQIASVIIGGLLGGFVAWALTKYKEPKYFLEEEECQKEK
jgi:hypothetical protein